MWYLTTQVSRATLPTLPHFDDLKPVIPLTFEGADPLVAQDVITALNELQNTHVYTANSSANSGYTLALQYAQETSVQFDGHRKVAVSLDNQDSDGIKRHLVDFILAIFADERRRINSVAFPNNLERDLRVVKYNPAYELVFSLLNGGGLHTIDRWPIRQSLSKIIQPLANDFDTLAVFSLESQIQYHAQLTFEPTRDGSSNGSFLQKSDLKNFINSAEWNLATAQSGSKPLNFIIYVPKPEHRPLLIKDGDRLVESNSFLLPQFGSIIIHNPTSQSPELTSQVLDNIISIASTHLLTLLGLPQIRDLAGDSSRWRRDGLLRQRTIEILTSAQDTLISLPKIVDQIPNMHVPDHITALVSSSLASLSSARRALQIGDVETALIYAKDALHKAEQAFFDDKMIALLYFPDEHKYGVYMPLFGPLFLPLAMAASKEVRHWLTKRRTDKSKKMS